MISKALNTQEYIESLPEDRKTIMRELHAVILKNLPAGFKETMSYGMITYVVPHSIYPKGYHCDPKQALPFISIASQKNFVAIYHMGIYADNELLHWFTEAFPKYSTTKLDMGKSCIRFKKPENIPFELIGKLAAKMTPEQWISLYEKAFHK
jgi:hypothetical protein